MKRRIAIIAALLIGSGLAVSDRARAACPTDKTEVTIVNPAGKVITVCVPEAAVPSLGGGGEVVIPASCPCFSQEDIDIASSLDPTLMCRVEPGVNKIGEPCAYARCVGESYSFESLWENQEECSFDEPIPAFRVAGSFCSDGSTIVQITDDEAEACVEIIRTFVP